MEGHLQSLRFTFHLKTLAFASTPSFLASPIGNSRARSFSIRAETLRGNLHSGSRAGREAAGSKGKSLIEDEAETLKRNGRDNRSSLSKRRFDSELGQEEEGKGWGISRNSNSLRKTRSSSGFSGREAKSSHSEEKISFRQRRGNGSSSSFMKREERDAEFSYKQGRKSILEISEEEEEENDDFIVDTVDNKKVGMMDLLTKSATLAELRSGDGEEQVSRSSSGGDDSYLSNTR